MKLNWLILKNPIALLLLFFFLSACASVTPNPNSPPLAAANTAVTLTFWHSQTGGDADALEALVNEFRKAYPKITLHAEQKSSEGDLLRQGRAAIALNQPPDFIIATPRTIADFARKDALVNLSPLMRDEKNDLRDSDRNDFLPGLLDLAPATFGFPFDASAVVLYYNVDLLQAAKVDVPPRTWDQFANAARATTKGNVRGWAMSPNANVFYASLFSRGGEMLNAAQTHAQFEVPGQKTLELIATLTRGDAAYLVASEQAARGDFAKGKTALLFGTTDDLALLADAIARSNSNLKWGVANVPQSDPSRPITAMTGSNLAIFKTSAERVQAAWLFARWLTLPEQSAHWSRATLSMPVRTSARSLLAANVPPNFQRLRDSFDSALPMMHSIPAVKDADLIDVAVIEMWTSVAQGTDPATAVKAGVSRINRILGQLP